MITEAVADGARRGAFPPQEVWCVDFEFRGSAGELPHVICMAAKECSGREIRLWRDELLLLRRAPFDTEGSIVVAYYASAEMGCFLQLGWPLPENVLDLFVEHKLSVNGLSRAQTERRKNAAQAGKALKAEGRDNLLSALAIRGLAHIDADDKEAMRELILTVDDPTPAQKKSILNYCASDVVGAEALLRYMIEHNEIDWPRALWRGRYIKAVSRIERCGVPIDTRLHARLSANWPAIRHNMVVEVNKAFGVFDGNDVFKEDKFADFVVRNDLPWPSLPSGQLALDEGTFDDMCRFHPRLRPLYEARCSLGKMRLTGLAVGPDERNRCLLSVFQSVTGRNQPSNSRFVFGPARWMRGLIKPPPGYAVAYVDWKSQEIAVAAALSGDERLLAAYQTGDIYAAFAKDAGLVPRWASKETFSQFDDIRDVCKTIILGIGYGMGPDAMAARAGLTKTDAANLIRIHKYTYRTFWQWVENTTAGALFSGKMEISSGWRRLVTSDPNIRSLQNWKIQATGAEMMRTTAIAATEAGLSIGAPVHDAFLLVSRTETFEQNVTDLRAIMARTGEAVIGIPVPADAKLVWAAGEMPPHKINGGTTKWALEGRYMDKRGSKMWEDVLKLLDEAERAAA
jgi:DNA polymerase I